MNKNPKSKITITNWSAFFCMVCYFILWGHGTVILLVAIYSMLEFLFGKRFTLQYFIDMLPFILEAGIRTSIIAILVGPIWSLLSGGFREERYSREYLDREHVDRKYWKQTNKIVKIEKERNSIIIGTLDIMVRALMFTLIILSFTYLFNFKKGFTFHLDFVLKSYAWMCVLILVRKMLKF